MAPPKNSAPQTNAPQTKAPQTNGVKKPKVTKSAKAGLTLSVSRVQRNLRKGNYADRIGTGGSVYLTAVLEYLSAELLELGGNAAIENNKQRITPRDIMMAIKNDSELDKLLGNVQISGSGVMPHIHPHLLPKNSKANKHRQNQQDESEETNVQSQEM